MSYIPLPNPLPITIGDSYSSDAFGKLRVSQPSVQFASFNEYKINPFNWVTNLAGTGSATHSTVNKITTLSTGGVLTGARSVLQSRMYCRYIPGASLHIDMTFVLGSAVTNCAKRVGYFDDDNGIFLELEGNGTVNLVRRSKTSGSVVETRIPQASWNKDPLNGTGDSGLTLNLDYAQILDIDLQYLGVGRVRVGFVIDGKAVYAHEFLHANLNVTQPYMATPNLPVRYEVINTGAAGGTGTIQAICAKVDAEGSTDLTSMQYSASRLTALATNTTLKPLISIRPGPNYNGIINRGWILPKKIDVLGDGNNDQYYELIWNATLTGAAWAPVSALAMGEFDTTATAVSLGSGVVIDSGFFRASTAKDLTGVFSSRPLVNSYDGTTPDTLTLAVRTTTAGASAYGSITWSGYW